MKKWLIAFSAAALLLTACGGEDTEWKKETKKNSAYSLKLSSVSNLLVKCSDCKI